MSPDLKLTYRILLAMFAVAEALALAGIVRAPHSLFLSEFSIGNIGTYALFAVVLYAFSRPARAEAVKVCLGGLALAAITVVGEFRRVPDRPYMDWVFVAAVGFGAAAVAAWLARLKRRDANASLTRDLLAASCIAPLADPTVSAYLQFTQALHPLTFDLGAYRFDGTLGFQPSATLALFTNQWPVVTGILIAAYYFQPYGISMLYAVQRVAARRQLFSIIAFQAVSALFSALFLYHLYPVAGPSYAFGGAFPAALPDPSTLEGISGAVARGARNGVPSMHFAWALALWLCARRLDIPWMRALFALWLGLTMLSTLALGEHYLLDLIVAIPLVVSVSALSAIGSPWCNERTRAVWVGLGLTLSWMLALRFGAGLLLAFPAFTWVVVAATVAASALVYRSFERALQVSAPLSAGDNAAQRKAEASLFPGLFTMAATKVPKFWNMAPDLRMALKAGLLALLVAELFALVGIAPAPHEKLIEIFRTGHAMYNFGSFAIHGFLLFAFSRPRWREFGQVILAGMLINGVLLWIKPIHDVPYWYWFHALGAGVGVAAVLAIAVRNIHEDGRRGAVAGNLLAAMALLTVYMLCIDSYLTLSAALHPRTFDLIAYKIDGTLGFDPAVLAGLSAADSGILRALAYGAYFFLPYGFSILYGLQVRDPVPPPVSIFTVFTVSAAAAVVLYHFCPVSGPGYLYGADFSLRMPASTTVSPELRLVAPVPRNGMPSMHFAWALILWLQTFQLSRIARACFALLVGFVFYATLALGEHYLVDLVAAAPFVVAVVALCDRSRPWTDTARRRAFAGGAAMLIGWILAVRYGVALFVAVPGLTGAAMMATVAASVWLYLPLRHAGQFVPAAVAGAARDAGSHREMNYTGLMFVISGFAALVYQVLFSKVLALTFGSQATATYTVLAVYMGGMALGAWLGGRLAARRGDALKLYAWCELGIGAYCLATPWIFKGIQALYIAMAAGVAPDAATLTIFRVLLGAMALLVPTVLMGATLPILARFFEGRAASLGVSVALLYGANTAGAALGALLAGYLIIPVLGVGKTTLAAAGLNFIVVWFALRLQQQARPPMSAPAAEGVALRGDVDSRRLGRIALAVLGVGGVVTLALEVNYMHLLAVVAGNSVYAFSLMLFAFLAGLGAGAEVARRLLKHAPPLLLLLAWLEFALAAVILAGVFLWEGLPAYFASFESYAMTRGFGSREVVRGLVCFVLMFPPALMIGALYPVAMECVGRAHPGAPVAALGRAAALNTLGNIAGVMAAGFWLLPMIGALRSIQLLAVVCLVVGLTVIACAGLHRRALAWGPVALVVALLALQPRSFDYTLLASGANVYFAKQNFGRVIDHEESVDGGLTTVTAPTLPNKPDLRVLLTNGKFQGTNDLNGEGIAQAGIAISPLLHTGARERALVIGYGTGMSARVLHDAGFLGLDIVDLSADIVRLADRYFGDVNGGVRERPGVNTFITDGRNFLMLQDRRYDLVSMEISSIWFAGAASLYNREFYQLVKRRLANDGVLQQWVQLHHSHPRDILYILGSLRSEFRHVWLYEIGGQGVIIAGNGAALAPRAAYLDRLARTGTLQPLLAMYGGSFRTLREQQLLDPAGVDRLLAGFKLPLTHWVSTDDNLILEYNTPRGNVLDATRSHEENIATLRRFAVENGDGRR